MCINCGLFLGSRTCRHSRLKWRERENEKKEKRKRERERERNGEGEKDKEWEPSEHITLPYPLPVMMDFTDARKPANQKHVMGWGEEKRVDVEAGPVCLGGYKL